MLFLIWRKKALARYGDWNVISQLMPEQSVTKTTLKFILGITALILLIFALVDPQTGSKLEKVKRKGIELIIALDVSNSMMAQDIRPNRLERAKQAISRLIDRLEGDRIGLIVFAGKAYTQLPITSDYAAAKMFINTVNTGMVPTQGTAIGDAISLAAGSFGDNKFNKAIVVITDGEDHQGGVLEQTEAVAKKGIAVYAIGMGLPDGAPIPLYNGDIQTGYKKDQQGNIIISKLDETLLQRIATLGKGMYVRATNSETGLNQIFDDINKIQKTEIESKQYSDYEDRFQYFVALALILLILDLFIFERKTKWLKKVKPFTLTLLVLLSFPAIAQKENKLLRQGNQAYEKGDYKSAEKDYRRALEINKESVKGQFNLGSAIYQEKNYEEAAKIYGNLAEKNQERSNQAKIFHNLGNSFLQAKEYEKSILAYKNALMNDPKDLDTKYNLEYAKMMLKKQQQQQQQQNKDQQKKEDKKDKQDQKQDQQNQNQKQNPDQKKISKEDAERMLEALKNDEKKTMQKVKKQKAKVQVVGVEKDW